MDLMLRLLLCGAFLVTSDSASNCDLGANPMCRCVHRDSDIECKAWNIEVMLQETFAFPPGTTSIRLVASSVMTLPNMTLRPDLKELYLPHNDIYHIQVDAFGNLGGLVVLDVSNNGLMRLSVNTFAGLTSLRSLDLSMNALLYPERGGWVMFGRQYLPQLRTLNLSHNALVNGVYKDFDFLEVLDLSHNSIQYFEDWDTREAFQFTPSLRVLNVSSNVLRLLARSMVSGETIEELVVTDNRWDCSDRTLAVCTEVAWLGRETYVREFNPPGRMLCDTPASRKNLSVYSFLDPCSAMYHDTTAKHQASSAAFIVFPIGLLLLILVSGLYMYRRRRKARLARHEFSDVRQLEMAT